MTSLATPVFDFIALAVSTAILSLAVAFVHVLVAQALESPYRLRTPAMQVRAKLRALPGTAPSRHTSRPAFAARSKLGLPGAA